MDANGDPNKSSNGELMVGVDRARELSVEGVEVPEDWVVEAGVMVAARSRETNRPFSRGWPFQELECASLLIAIVSESICKKTRSKREVVQR